MIEISVVGERIHCRAPYTKHDHCKAIPGARWDSVKKVWTYPATPETARAVSTVFNGSGVKASAEFMALNASGGRAVKQAQASLGKPFRPPSKTDSWQHQAAAYKSAEHRPAYMLAMDMGTGKSKVAVDLLGSRQDCRTVLITAPLSVLDVWPREFVKHSLFDWKTLVLKKGAIAKRAVKARNFIEICRAKGRRCAVIINHEGLWRDPFATLAKTIEFDALIVDESHRAKQHNGRLSLFLGQLTSIIPLRLALTGTPMPHSPIDIFAQFRFLDPSVYGKSFHRFKMHYCLMGGWQNKEIVGYRNEAELQEKFYSMAFRVTKAEALDLPEEISVERHAAMDKKTASIYNDLENHFFAEVEAGRIKATYDDPQPGDDPLADAKGGRITPPNTIVKLLRLQQVTSGHIKTDDGNTQWLSNHKIDLLKDILPDLQMPIVIFARFTPDIAAVEAVCKKAGLRIALVTGKIKMLTDEATIPEDADVVIAQIQAGGLGIDLSLASTAIYYSSTLSLGEYEQSKARLHRPGQKNKVTYIHLVTEGTIDEGIYRAFDRRRDVIEAVLTGDWR